MVLRAANPSAERFFGYAVRELLDTRVTRLIPSAVGRIRAGAYLEAEAIPRDGRTVSVSLHCGEFESEGWTIIIVHDISKWKSMEHDLHLQRVSANVSRLATNEFFVRITHSLKTPLHAIVGFSDILADEALGLLDERHKRFLHHINDNGHRLQRLVEDLLDLSRAEAGRFAPRTDAVHLDDLVRRMVSLVADLAQERRITVSVDTDPDLPSIAADESRLKTAIYNILDSALRSASDGSRLAARTGRHGDAEVYLRISVSDLHGHTDEIGGAPTLEPSLYARSFQATGLGIPLATRFIEMHGGHLTVEYDQEAGSMSILVTLPTAHNAMVQSS